MNRKANPPCPSCGMELLYMGTIAQYEQNGMENNIYHCRKWECEVVELHLLLPVGLYSHSLVEEHVHLFLN